MVTNIERIQNSINLSKKSGFPPKGIIISNKFQRDIFINGELPKNTTLEAKFELIVILDDRFNEVVGVVI